VDGIISIGYIIEMKLVAYTPAARRAWRKLPDDVQVHLTDALRRYAATGQGDVVRLKGVSGARLRLGDYRVIFVETVDVIEIRSVGHRRDVYR
jgi:mRNA interferase RelE/StbE